MKVKLSGRDKGLAIFLLLLFSVLIPIYLFRTMKLKKSGVYVIAKLDNVRPAGNRGANYYYTFMYNGKSYKCHIGANTRLDTLVFVLVYSKDPSICKILPYDKIPSCLGLKDVPTNGWKDLPNIKCN